MALISKILVPTDFSPDADRALEYAVELAARFSASIRLVHVYRIPVVALPEGVVTLMPDLPGLMKQLEDGLAGVAARARKLGVSDVETTLAEGVDWHEILNVAKEHGCDLIVMGTRGRTGIPHLLLGSVAEKVVRKAECPVLTVGRKAA
jgi:nucleotide-binding universal stress UspA family protein